MHGRVYVGHTWGEKGKVVHIKQTNKQTATELKINEKIEKKILSENRT